jgi:hypothetical protein
LYSREMDACELNKVSLRRNVEEIILWFTFSFSTHVFSVISSACIRL